LLSVGVKDAESDGKERQIRRPFHLHVQFLRRLRASANMKIYLDVL
jgi:hypothetical protein